MAETNQDQTPNPIPPSEPTPQNQPNQTAQVNQISDPNSNPAPNTEPTPNSNSQQNEPKDKSNSAIDNPLIGGKEPAPNVTNPNVPETYDPFTINDQQVDDYTQETFSQVSKDLGLSQNQAQSAIVRINDYLNNRVEQYAKSWKEATLKDPEIGGTNFKQTQTYANKALTQFFNPQAIQILQGSGLLNHPDIIKGLRAIGQRASSDNPTGILGSNGGNQKKENPLKSAYSKYDDL